MRAKQSGRGKAKKASISWPTLASRSESRIRALALTTCHCACMSHFVLEFINLTSLSLLIHVINSLQLWSELLIRSQAHGGAHGGARRKNKKKKATNQKTKRASHGAALLVRREGVLRDAGVGVCACPLCSLRRLRAPPIALPSGRSDDAALGCAAAAARASPSHLSRSCIL